MEIKLNEDVPTTASISCRPEVDKNFPVEHDRESTNKPAARGVRNLLMPAQSNSGPILPQQKENV